MTIWTWTILKHKGIFLKSSLGSALLLHGFNKPSMYHFLHDAGVLHKGDIFTLPSIHTIDKNLSIV